MFLHNLLNALVNIANKIGLQKKLESQVSFAGTFIFWYVAPPVTTAFHADVDRHFRGLPSSGVHCITSACFHIQ
jgi:hypothetical protein